MNLLPRRTFLLPTCRVSPQAAMCPWTFPIVSQAPPSLHTRGRLRGHSGGLWTLVFLIRAAAAAEVVPRDGPGEIAGITVIGEAGAVAVQVVPGRTLLLGDPLVGVVGVLGEGERVRRRRQRPCGALAGA